MLQKAKIASYVHFWYQNSFLAAKVFMGLRDLRTNTKAGSPPIIAAVTDGSAAWKGAQYLQRDRRRAKSKTKVCVLEKIFLSPPFIIIAKWSWKRTNTLVQMCSTNKSTAYSYAYGIMSSSGQCRTPWLWVQVALTGFIPQNYVILLTIRLLINEINNVTQYIYVKWICF